MATPVVSGTAAIIRQYFEQGYYPSGKKNESVSDMIKFCYSDVFHHIMALLKSQTNKTHISPPFQIEGYLCNSYGCLN